MSDAHVGSAPFVGARRPPGNLPIPLTHFVGRSREVAEITDVLRHTRLLTLVGTAGSGKTRLAIEIASRIGGTLPGGACFVDLAPLTDPALLAATFAGALGLTEASARSPSDNLIEMVSSMNILLVVDNCEHMAEPTARLAERILAASASLTILATSRHPLGASGEQTWRMTPLVLKEATQLFADRAHLRSGFSLTDRNRNAVDQICLRVDCLPLAIELAAGRTQVLTPQQILERLNDAFALLTDDRHSAAMRQRTLQAAVDWSYQLLVPDEQSLFNILSVFAGGFDLPAAEALCGPGTLNQLGALIDKSLVIGEAHEDGAMRYRLLEVLRQYGQARLAAEKAEESARERHATYYLAIACRMDRHGALDDLSEWLPTFRREESNFRAALEWMRSRRPHDGLQMATALARCWQASGRVTEGRFWLERMLSVADADKQLLTLALHRTGLLAYFQGDYEAAQARVSASVELKRELGDDAGVARRLGTLAEVALARGDSAGALRLAEESQTLSLRFADPRSQAWANVHLGMILLYRGDHDLAEARFTESLNPLRSARDYIGLAYALSGLAAMQLEKGDLTAVREQVRELTELVDHHMVWIEDPEWPWICLLLAEAEGRYESAIRLSGAIARLEREGKVWHPAFKNKYQPAVDRARRHIKPSEADRLIAEGALMTRAQLVAEGFGQRSEPRDQLSRRELEIAQLVAKGLTNSEIASKLFLSKRTAESHLDHIKAKLGLRNRSQVVAWVISRASVQDT